MGLSSCSLSARSCAPSSWASEYDGDGDLEGAYSAAACEAALERIMSDALFPISASASAFSVYDTAGEGDLPGLLRISLSSFWSSSFPMCDDGDVGSACDGGGE